MSAPATRATGAWRATLGRRARAVRVAAAAWWISRVTRGRVQTVAELGGFTSLVVAGFHGSQIAGYVVLGVVLLFLGNGRW